MSLVYYCQKWCAPLIPPILSDALRGIVQICPSTTDAVDMHLFPFAKCIPLPLRPKIAAQGKIFLAGQVPQCVQYICDVPESP